MSIYRKIVWYYKGCNEYTKSGYLLASKSFNESDLDVNCNDKSYLITGANSGIGKSIAAAIAKRGGTIHMVCRNQKTAEEARSDIVKDTNNQNVHVHILDLSDPGRVSEFATDFAKHNDKLDVLVNNAGCMVPRTIPDSGIEVNFATNSLAPYMLTKLLRPLLHKSAEPRVVMVSSGGMLVQRLDCDDPQFNNLKVFDSTMAYAQHKRQQVVMTEVLAEEDPKVFYSVMHPGWADTPAVRSAMPDFYNKMKDRLRSAEEGADTALWLAISPAALQQKSGLFFQDRQAVSPHLPLAWTSTTPEENHTFITYLNSLLDRFKSD